MSSRDIVKEHVLASDKVTIQPTLAMRDAIAITVGIVIGAGIFETPALVAANAGSAGLVAFMWLLGGIISLIGALCFAELATTYPHPGGNYHYLQRAFGKNVAFLFAWARMMVIQPGSIVLLAFVFGDYASQIFSLGVYSPSIYALVAIILLTITNLLGMRQSKWTQNFLTLMEVLGLVLVAIVGFTVTSTTAPATTTNSTGGSFGLAMILVLLSYGGWNEAVYISAELRDVRRNMLRSLLWSIGIISAVYLLINLAYLQGLGLTRMAQSEAVAADLMRQAIGTPGVWLIGLLIAIAALGSISATILTGARTNYALGETFTLFSFMGHWGLRNTPTHALLFQAAIAVALVLLGTWQRQGFQTMVDYTAPVFWFFLLLTGISLIVLRRREPQVSRPFRVPLYPLIPILFCLICGYLLYSSLVYTGMGALVGVAIVAAGIPLLLWMHQRDRRSQSVSK